MNRLMKFFEDNGMGYMFAVAALLTIIIILLLTCSCQPRMTETQWSAQYKPADVNEAAAMVILQTGKQMAEQKARAASRIDFAIFVCLIGAIGCGVAIVLGTSGMKSTGLLGLFVCIGSVALLKFYQDFPLWFSYLGGGIALTAGSFAAWKHRGALREVVGNVEAIKNEDVLAAPQLLGVGNIIKRYLQDQSPATKKLVAGIRKTIK